MPYLSIIIPGYNEEKRLPETLKKVEGFVRSQKYKTEVIVVDDGSTDATVSIARNFSKQFPELRVIENSQNKGKGMVVRQGMLAATGEYRLFMDADSSSPVTSVETLLKNVSEYDVVIGSRYIELGSIKVKQPLTRRIISRGSNWLIQRTILPGIKDTQCGFKLFSAVAAEKIFKRQSMTGWSFDFEILTIARELGYSIKEVAVPWSDSKNSNLRAFKATTHSLKDLLKIFLKVKSHRYR